MGSLWFSPNCQSTAMGILPHTDIEKFPTVRAELERRHVAI
jgi:hypothetical protein